MIIEEIEMQHETTSYGVLNVVWDVGEVALADVPEGVQRRCADTASSFLADGSYCAVTARFVLPSFRQ
jgi:hypothetical protein